MEAEVHHGRVETTSQPWKVGVVVVVVAMLLLLKARGQLRRAILECRHSAMVVVTAMWTMGRELVVVASVDLGRTITVATLVVVASGWT